MGAVLASLSAVHGAVTATAVTTTKIAATERARTVKISLATFVRVVIPHVVPTMTIVATISHAVLTGVNVIRAMASLSFAVGSVGANVTNATNATVFLANVMSATVFLANVMNATVFLANATVFLAIGTVVVVVGVFEDVANEILVCNNNHTSNAYFHSIASEFIIALTTKILAFSSCQHSTCNLHFAYPLHKIIHGDVCRV